MTEKKMKILPVEMADVKLGVKRVLKPDAWGNKYAACGNCGCRLVNVEERVRRSLDARMPNSRVKRIARDFRNEANDVMEKLYPGYKLQDVQVRYSDIMDGVYIRCVLRRIRT